MAFILWVVIIYETRLSLPDPTYIGIICWAQFNIFLSHICFLVGSCAKVQLDLLVLQCVYNITYNLKISCARKLSFQVLYRDTREREEGTLLTHAMFAREGLSFAGCGCKWVFFLLYIYDGNYIVMNGIGRREKQF